MTTVNNTTLAQVQLNQVIEQLNNLSTDELVSVYIEYASNNSYETIYNLDESTINELYTSPWQALYDSNHKDFNDRDYFFTYNGNGHMVSFSNEDDDNCPIDIEELAQWIVDNKLFNEYHIEVTTLEDMLASIEDNINDADLLVLALMMDKLSLDLSDGDTVEINGYKDLEEYYIETLIDELSDYDYNQLNDIITLLGIEYK